MEAIKVKWFLTYKHLKLAYNSKNYCSFDIFVLRFSSQNYLKNVLKRKCERHFV